MTWRWLHSARARPSQEPCIVSLHLRKVDGIVRFHVDRVPNARSDVGVTCSVAVTKDVAATNNGKAGEI
jgi:hypothetical protein